MPNRLSLSLILVLIPTLAPALAVETTPPYLIDTTQTPRSISFENPTGGKGQGGQAASNLGVGRKGSPAKTLEPGEVVELCNVEGQGIIRHIWITTRNEPENLRGLVLRAYWDNQEHPSIECPLGDFLGFSHGKVTSYDSAVHSIGPKAAMNFWLPMPFRERARLTLANERPTNSRLYYQIDYTLEEELPENAGSLHALFRRENPTTLKQDFEILPKRNGVGRYIGCLLGVRYLEKSWWGEGEVKVYLDGDTEFPTICGTGSEDYVGLSWGIQEATQRYLGCNLNREGYVSMYRWHLPDPIVWKEDIRVTIQQLSWAPYGYDERQDDWSVATFWYEPVPSEPLPTLPSYEERTADLPQSNPLHEKIGKITPIEAAHLVESQLPRCDVAEVSVEEELGLPLYSVRGEVNGDRFEAYVDAERSRVLSIERDGEEVYRWEGILISAHRGANRLAPENTAAAIRRAVELGANVVEMDVRQTRDGHLVLLHDSTLNRTTDGSGAVADMTLEEIRKYDAGSWFSEEFKGEKVPTFDEALEALGDHAKPDIDLKNADPEKVIDALRAHGFNEGVTLYCNDLEKRRAMVELSDGGVWPRPKTSLGKWDLPGIIEEWDPPLVNVEWEEFSEDFIKEIHLAGMKAFVNVHSRHDTEYKMIAAMEAGADYIQCDQVDV
ncbi:MAG: DUF2961 domain-containing protein, partial [Candidatus Omnitrophica bacterium]|nr:DUF2961 domain-containing protein [Candidatus Omnitrophota bacterium]